MDGPDFAAPRAVPRLVILAGSLSPTSRCDRLAAWCARRATARDATASYFRGEDLEFGFYRHGRVARGDVRVRRYLQALAAADGVILISPAYHGTISGLLKNALDYLDELACAPEPYLDNRPVGCVAVAGGDQGGQATLATLRTIAHSLRAWPTPLGLALSGDRAATDSEGRPASRRTAAELEVMLGQVLGAARRRAMASSSGGPERTPEVSRS